MPLRFLLFAVFVCAAPLLVLAQVQPLPDYLRHPYRFRHINTEHGGLSQNTVFAALQDRKGFLWIATGDGLNRYDGYMSCPPIFGQRNGKLSIIFSRLDYHI